MNGETRSERTERLLACRLEELAGALERSGASAYAIAPLVESASVATRHAVAVGLVSSERAEQIWRVVLDRHPVLEALASARRGRLRAAA